ncbi:TIR domain-containing protein [Ciceribacter ferrooxidans]|uniref:DNA-binding protein n=1 Tax=Ciceribacter ferrooxidans TaxID=2509717 RepID=A0A4V1RM08_9HYPH|nr:nucleotide-binding protein [Ciceribacter ferrooxidans]RYB98042.1 DNA-binding protein [Ciceribacter ferrooxidans]
MNRFDGSIDDLKAIVDQTGVRGTWTTHDNNHYKFTAATGAVLNWWDTRKKTVSFQGPDGPKQALEAAVNAACEGNALAVKVPAKPVEADPNGTRIFLVHGHDDASREQLERILLLLGLEPFVLQNTSGGGMTIIEALERQIGKEPEAKFGIVLMTPDDMGYANRDGADKSQPRARQNVVMEMGMLLSSLTREKVVILVKGHLEQPSDAHGIIYLHFNNHVKEVVPRLTERLRAAGFDIPADRITKAAS